MRRGIRKISISAPSVKGSTKTPSTAILGFVMRFFIPGTHPALSLAELSAVLGSETDFSRGGSEAFLIATDRDAGELQARLGGIVKIGRIVGELPRYNAQGAIDLITPFALKTAEASEGKIIYGLSVYALGNKGIAAQIKNDRQRIGLELKKRLKETGRSVRYVDSKESDLSAVIVTENGLIESAGEYCLIAAADRVYVGQTEAVQDYKDWSRRDYGRPASDPESGMLPPKLARMMVNLGVGHWALGAGKTIMDPFCGSGTVLMEAGLLGFDLIGNDIEAKAVADTKKNLAWINLEAEILHGDASDIGKRVVGSVDVVVTEPYLGPPRLKKPTPKEIGLLVGKLMTLYERAFGSIFTLLPAGGRSVVAFPVFETTEHRLFLPIVALAKKLGLEIVNPIPDSAPIAFKERTQNGGLLYRRPDAIVSREILILRK